MQPSRSRCKICSVISAYITILCWFRGGRRTWCWCPTLATAPIQSSPPWPGTERNVLSWFVPAGHTSTISWHFGTSANIGRTGDGLQPQSTYIKSTTVYVPCQNWDSPNPSLASECAPPPRTGGEMGTLAPADEGLGESQFRRLEKRLSTLPALCLQRTDLQNFI